MRYTEIKPKLDEQVLDEVKMSPSALQKFANSPEAEGMLVGIEFEMGVPDVEDVDEDPNWEYDYDQDERARSIDDIIDFFRSGEFSNLGSRQASSMRDEMYEQFNEWQNDQIGEAVRNSDQLDDLIRDKLREDYISVDDYMDDAREELGEEAPDDAVQSRAIKLMEEAIDEMISERSGRDYDNAFDDAVQELEDDLRNSADYDEEEWLRDIDVVSMQDAEREWSLDWPHMYDSNEGGGGEDLDSLANEFSQAMGGVKVNTSSGYHGATRDGSSWIIEPDGSIDAERGDAGLEFVSPPMPLKQGLETLKQFYAWANKRGCYTNDSTGLHMNISVPDMSTETLDYVKLALFMGDEYLLKQFGRQYNSYCKSAMSKIRDRIRPEDVPAVLSQVKQNLNSLASKIIHSGITEKYTSINTRDKYVEFRGPGGDYLDSDPLDLVNTALRLAMSLRIATDPEAYKQEYAKKLYKLVEQSPEADDSVELFSQYALGQINKSELAARLEFAQRGRKLEKTKKDVVSRMADREQVKEKIRDLPLKWRQFIRDLRGSNDQQLQSLLNNIESGEYNEELDQEQRGIVTDIVSNELTYRKQQGEKKQYWVTKRDGEGGKQMVLANNENEAILLGGKNIGLTREQSISQLKAVEKTERSTIELFSGLPADWKEFIDNIEDASIGVLRGGLDSMTTGRWQYRNLDDDEVEYIKGRIEVEMQNRQEQGENTFDRKRYPAGVKDLIDTLTPNWRDWVMNIPNKDEEILRNAVQAGRAGRWTQDGTMTQQQANLVVNLANDELIYRESTGTDKEDGSIQLQFKDAVPAATSRELFDSLPENIQRWLTNIQGHGLQNLLNNLARWNDPTSLNVHNLSQEQHNFAVNTIEQELRRRNSNNTVAANAGNAENAVYQSLPAAYQEFIDQLADKSDLGLINILANPNATTALNDQQAAYFRIALKHELRRRGINPDSTQEPAAQQTQLIQRDDPVTSNDPEAQDGPGTWLVGNHTYGRETLGANSRDDAIARFARQLNINIADVSSEPGFVAQLQEPAQQELDLNEMRRLAGLR